MKKNQISVWERQKIIEQKVLKRKANVRVEDIVFPKNLTKKFLIIYLVIMVILIAFMGFYLAGSSISVKNKIWSKEVYEIVSAIITVLVVLLLIYPLTYKRRKKAYIKRQINKDKIK